MPELNKHEIKLYAEPISSDAGTAIGASYLAWHQITNSEKILPFADSLYLGPSYGYDDKEIGHLADTYNATLQKVEMTDVVKLMCEKNIVAMFQGRSESGPRALGNRRLMYDPTDPNGKDHVNKVKRREYFRPFAGTILAAVSYTHLRAHET